MKWLTLIAALVFSSAALGQVEAYKDDGTLAVSGRTVTITNGTTTSEVIDTGGYTLPGIMTDADFDGTVYTWYCTPTLLGTPVIIRDTSGVACTVTTAISSLSAPTVGDCAIAVGSCRYLVIDT